MVDKASLGAAYKVLDNDALSLLDKQHVKELKSAYLILVEAFGGLYTAQVKMPKFITDDQKWPGCQRRKFRCWFFLKGLDHLQDHRDGLEQDIDQLADLRLNDDIPSYFIIVDCYQKAAEFYHQQYLTNKTRKDDRDSCRQKMIEFKSTMSSLLQVYADSQKHVGDKRKALRYCQAADECSQDDIWPGLDLTMLGDDAEIQCYLRYVQSMSVLARRRRVWSEIEKLDQVLAKMRGDSVIYVTQSSFTELAELRSQHRDLTQQVIKLLKELALSTVAMNDYYDSLPSEYDQLGDIRRSMVSGKFVCPEYRLTDNPREIVHKVESVPAEVDFFTVAINFLKKIKAEHLQTASIPMSNLAGLDLDDDQDQSYATVSLSGISSDAHNALLDCFQRFARHAKERGGKVGVMRSFAYVATSLGRDMSQEVESWLRVLQRTSHVEAEVWQQDIFVAEVNKLVQDRESYLNLVKANIKEIEENFLRIRDGHQAQIERSKLLSEIKPLIYNCVLFSLRNATPVSDIPFGEFNPSRKISMSYHELPQAAQYIDACDVNIGFERLPKLLAQLSIDFDLNLKSSPLDWIDLYNRVCCIIEENDKQNSQLRRTLKKYALFEHIQRDLGCQVQGIVGNQKLYDIEKCILDAIQGRDELLSVDLRLVDILVNIKDDFPAKVQLLPNSPDSIKPIPVPRWRADIIERIENYLHRCGDLVISHAVMDGDDDYTGEKFAILKTMLNYVPAMLGKACFRFIAVESKIDAFKEIVSEYDCFDSVVQHLQSHQNELGIFENFDLMMESVDGAWDCHRSNSKLAWIFDPTRRYETAQSLPTISGSGRGTPAGSPEKDRRTAQSNRSSFWSLLCCCGGDTAEAEVDPHAYHPLTSDVPETPGASPHPRGNTSVNSTDSTRPTSPLWKFREFGTS